MERFEHARRRLGGPATYLVSGVVIVVAVWSGGIGQGNARVKQQARSKAGAAPVHNALYGGGAIGPRYQPHLRSGIAWVNLSSDSTGKLLTIYVDVFGTCHHTKAPTDAEIISFYPKPIPVARGRFSTSGVTPSDNSQGPAGASYSFSGHFVSAERAVGTLQAQLTYTAAGGDVVHCVSPTTQFVVNDPKQRLSTGKRIPNGAYFGNVYKPAKFPFLLRLTADGRRVVQAATEFNFYCPASIPIGNQSNAFSANETSPGGPLRKDGTFRVLDAYQTPVPGQPGLSGQAHSVLRGGFGRYRATGTWQIDLTVHDNKTHQVVGTCTSRLMTWEAAL